MPKPVPFGMGCYRGPSHAIPDERLLSSDELLPLPDELLPPPDELLPPLDERPPILTLLVTVAGLVVVLGVTVVLWVSVRDYQVAVRGGTGRWLPGP